MAISEVDINDKSIADIVVSLLSNDQLEIYDALKKCNWSIESASKYLGITKAKISGSLNNRILRGVITVVRRLEDAGVDGRLQMPTLEFTIGKLMDLLEDVETQYADVKKKLLSVDDPEEKTLLSEMFKELREEKAKYLKQITDFQAKFGDMIKDDKLKLSRLSGIELIDYAKGALEKIVGHEKALKWYEGDIN